MIESGRRVVLLASIILLGVGVTMMVLAVHHNDDAPDKLAYVDRAACATCPAGTRLDSVQVQQRGSTTVFAVHGRWRGSSNQVSSAVRLVANGDEIVLTPLTSKSGLAITTATENGTPLPAERLAAVVRPSTFLVEVKTSLRLPLRFAIGLWDGTGYTARLPRAGTLVWDGTHEPTLSGAVSTPNPADAPSELTALAQDCTELTGGRVAAYLQAANVTDSTQPDPRRGVPTREVSASLPASPVGVTAPFSFTIAVLPPGSQARGGQASLIDRVGEVQLWVTSDGTHLHKGIRTFARGAWTMREDSAADALTYRIADTSVSMYWPGLGAADRVGIVAAAATGCRAVDIDAHGTPLHTMR